ncbi:MAG: hypothetical protein ACETWR_19620 [Anaerolineae bacterium]
MSNRKYLPIFGVLFVGGALLCGLLTWYSSSRAANRVKEFTPVTTVAALGDGQPGREILVEGHVSSRNPVQPLSPGFVAYIREEREIDTDDEGTPTPGSWSVSSRVTPPLLLELSDGLVQVENDDYDLENGTTIEEEPSSFDRYSDTRYKGIEIGDSVMAVGVVVEDTESPQIRADFIARGIQESYVASQRSAGVIFFVISIVVAVVGSIFIMWDRVSGLLPRRRQQTILRSNWNLNRILVLVFSILGGAILCVGAPVFGLQGSVLGVVFAAVGGGISILLSLVVWLLSRRR